MDSKFNRTPLHFEPIEPRLLFSGGLEGIATSDVLLSTAAVVTAPQAEQATASEQDTLVTGNTQVEEEYRHELVIIDLNTPDYQGLMDDLLASEDTDRQIDVVHLDPDRNGIDQISTILDGYQGLDAVHIVTHGDREALQLGTTTLEANSLAGHATAINGWSRALGTDADILLYGCNLASSPAGIELINTLGVMTGADVAASDDLTGDPSLGGDWDLEYHTGDIETAIAFSEALQDGWTGVLAAARSGAEFQINATTADNQQDGAVATNASGNFVVVWTSDNQDGDGSGIYGQRYDAGGNTVGSEFRVNTSTPDNQREPSVAMDAAGNFVVVWTSDNQDGDGSGIYGQRYDPGGNTVGSEFRINTTSTDQQSAPDVAMGGSGEFVVVWASNSQDGSQTGIFSQRYDAAGNAVGAETQVNAYSTGKQENPAVAMDETNRYVVTWESIGQDGSSWGVYARLYDSTGSALTGDIQTNTTTLGNQRNSDVAMDADGDFVVVWEGNGTGDNSGIFARLYDSTGIAKGDELLVNSTTGNVQRDPSVAMDAGGGFVVVWTSNNQDGDKTGIYAQQFDAAGNTVGSELMVNTSTLEKQENPGIALHGPDDFIVVWQGNHRDSGGTWDVFGQRYTSPNTDPVIGLPGGPVGYTENAAPVIIDTGATLADPDSADFAGGTLTVDLTAGATADDRLAIRSEGTAAGQIGISGNNVTYGGVQIGTFSGGDGMTPLVITLNAGADLAAVQALMRNITFHNVSENPATTNRTVRFVLSDGDGGTSNPVSETIMVTAVNDPPLASDDGPVAVGEGQRININLAGNDTDVDDGIDPASITITGDPVYGSISVNADGSVDYTHDGSENFADSFAYSIRDAGGAISNTATVHISVNPANDAPDAVDDTYGLNEDSILSGNVLANDTDIDLDTLAASLVDGAANGTLILGNDGSFTYTPDRDFNGTDSFTYQVDDGNGGLDTATVTLSVAPVNDAPTAKDDSYELNENDILGAGGTGVLANDADIDGDPLIATLVSGPGHGTLTLNSDGSFTYTPAAGFSGTDSFTYMANDSNGEGATATVTLTVNTVSVPATDPEAGDELPDGEVDTDEKVPAVIEGIAGMRMPDLVAGEERAPVTFVDNQPGDNLHSAIDRDARERLPYEKSARQVLLSAMNLFTSANSGLWQMIDLMKDQMGDRQGGNQNLLDLFTRSATGMTLTLSAGIVTWALRGGSVLAGMLSSMPLWKGIDPLPLIDDARRENQDRAGRYDTDDMHGSERVAEELLDAVGSIDAADRGE